MKGVHWIDLGQWPCTLALILEKRPYNGFLRQQCGKNFAGCPPFPDAGNCQVLKSPSNMILLIAVNSKYGDETEQMLTLVHEATHAMRYLFEYVGEKAPGTETEAYLVEHIVRGGLKAIAA